MGWGVRRRGLEGSVRPALPTVVVVTSERESTAELAAVKLTALTWTAAIQSITSPVTVFHTTSL